MFSRTVSSCEKWGLIICFTDWLGRLNEKTWGVAGIEQTIHSRGSKVSFGVCLVERPLTKGGVVLDRRSHVGW